MPIRGKNVPGGRNIQAKAERRECARQIGGIARKLVRPEQSE